MTETLDPRLAAAAEAYARVPISPLVPWKATGKQMAFLANMGRESLYGGTARSMKSVAALMAAMQFACVPGYNAIIFRRERVTLELPDGLIDLAGQWFRQIPGCHWSGDKYRWTFPSGATLTFGYIKEREDLYKYHSSGYQFMAFEEVAEWPTSTEWLYMFSRLTPKVDYGGGLAKCECHGWSVADVPLRMRATANPGGPGQAWVRLRFILPWRDKTNTAARGLFFPASYRDNPYINHAEYESAVSQLPVIDQKRLLGGDWDISAPGDRFSRDWFKKLRKSEMPPLHTLKITRRWDMATTKPNVKNKDPDWTVGALVGHRTGDEGDEYYLLDILRFRATSGEVRRKMRATSKLDDKRCKRHVPIRVEREPGSQARMAMQMMKAASFKGLNFRAIPSRIPKTDRIDVLAVNAEAGEWYVCEEDEFLEAFLDEAEAFGHPGVKDDQLDAVAGAQYDLTKSSAGARTSRAPLETDDASDEVTGYPGAKPSRTAPSEPRTSSASGWYGSAFVDDEATEPVSADRKRRQHLGPNGGRRRRSIAEALNEVVNGGNRSH